MNTSSEQNKKSVCIIDDDSIYLMLVNRIISMNRLSEDVVEFANGKDAFDKLRQMNLMEEKMPDIILLDLNMPIWNGWDFLDEFQKLNLAVIPDVYIITSSANPEEKAKGLSYPIVKGFLVKPISVDSLRSIFLP